MLVLSKALQFAIPHVESAIELLKCTRTQGPYFFILPCKPDGY